MIDLSFHHVGVGTQDFDGAIETYQKLGHRLHSRVDDPRLRVRVAFLACPNDSGPWIEVLAPLGEESPLKSLIARRSLPSPYHTCYATRELEPAADALRELGFLPLGEPQPALAFADARVLFLFSQSIGLVELVESPPPWLSATRHDGEPPRVSQ